MNTHTTHILLIGAGKMGGALLSAWIHKGIPTSAITVVDPHAKHTVGNLRVHASVDAVSTDVDCILLAVKPQSMDGVLQQLAAKNSKALVLSIAAGKTLGYFEQHLGAGAAVVRAMPNTPAIIGKGISALIANKNVNEQQKQLAEALLRAAGRIVWLEEEAQMDAVTAISGSGPAYVFLFLDAFIAAGIAQGLPEEIATELAVQTVRGSVKLTQKSNESLAQLRKNVTSPGGTTEAALKVLMKGDALKHLLHEAVEAAAKRSKELA